MLDVTMGPKSWNDRLAGRWERRQIGSRSTPESPRRAIDVSSWPWRLSLWLVQFSLLAVAWLLAGPKLVLGLVLLYAAMSALSWLLARWLRQRTTKGREF